METKKCLDFYFFLGIIDVCPWRCKHTDQLIETLITPRFRRGYLKREGYSGDYIVAGGGVSLGE